MASVNRKHAIFIHADGIGRGDDALGKLLIVKFLKEITEMPEESTPGFICLMNGAVKLACEGATDDAETVQLLKSLDAKGVQILCCGTCLKHFDLLNSLSVGVTSNMCDISTVLVNAEKVLTV
ncbi:MAG: hypothetical protein B1H03_03235 [Planctomycetales bacterium 4484_113]|nr:MAG: hypothetical protein B1H03_03235 [Planctomycetales bacterium 4484_113]